MKKIIITIALIATAAIANAQTITAQGKSVKLTANDIKYLKSFKLDAINKALDLNTDLKNNDTADIILKLLNK